jgi:hypothetical protein
MVVNDNATNLMLRGALGFFASELAPTGIACYLAITDVNKSDSRNRCSHACNRR